MKSVRLDDDDDGTQEKEKEQEKKIEREIERRGGRWNDGEVPAISSNEPGVA